MVLVFLCGLTFFSVCFVPYFPIADQLSIRLEDIILPFAVFLVLPHYKSIFHWYFLILIIWGVWGVVTMAVNVRSNVVNDYFELYKLFKFFVFTLMFALLFKRKTDVFGFISVIFLFLVMFNMMHYFNLFDFNKKVMPLYCPNSMQLEYFGRNSLGGVATKRILGTVGNPNINAILFSFFMVYFISFLRRKTWHLGKLYFFISIAMILYTQSRTSMASTAIIIALFILFTKPDKKQLLQLSIGITLAFGLVWFSDLYSLQYITGAKWNVEQNGSLRGRLEVWRELLGMIAKSPIFGYGINKNYFYEHNLFSENEYILVMWRYGIPGLFFYGVMLFGWIWDGRKTLLKSFSDESLAYLLAVVMIGFNALTNNPLSSPMIMVLFAAITGFYISNKLETKAKTLNNNKLVS